MKLNKTKILAFLAIIEAVIIVSLLASRFRVQVRKTIAHTVANPLVTALEYDSSDQKFEELVNKYPEYINYRSKNEGSFNWPILADCAFSKRTNWVRILVAHGADVDVALQCVQELDAEEAVMLLEQLRPATKAMP